MDTKHDWRTAPYICYRCMDKMPSMNGCAMEHCEAKPNPSASYTARAKVHLEGLQATKATEERVANTLVSITSALANVRHERDRLAKENVALTEMLDACEHERDALRAFVLVVDMRKREEISQTAYDYARSTINVKPTRAVEPRRFWLLDWLLR